MTGGLLSLAIIMLVAISSLTAQYYRPTYLPPSPDTFAFMPNRLPFYPAPFNNFGQVMTNQVVDPFYEPLFPPPLPRAVPSASTSFTQGLSDGLANFPGPLSRAQPPPYAMGAYPGFGRFRRGGGGLIDHPFHNGHPQMVAASLTDKDNFQPQGCAWDLVRLRCADVIGLCKGGCRDFSFDPVGHDCRCVPFGYSALLRGLMMNAQFERK